MYKGKTVLTGIQPTGTPHLGNLVAAMQPIIEMSQNAGKSYLFIADLHSLNAVKNPKDVQSSTLEVAASMLALGLDMEHTIFFRQSDMPEHQSLAMYLMNVTPKGLMNRAHSYKAAVDKNMEAGVDADVGINMGLYTYPILMTADILLYDADYVPVGQDQKQHVEFARDIAGSFNTTYGRDILILPEPVIKKETGVIPGLDGRKMSKSYGNTIPIFEESKKLRKLIMKIVTDSKLPEEPKNPDESTIIQLYQNFATEGELKDLRARFEEGGIGYGDAKQLLFEAVDRHLEEPRERYKDLLSRPKDIEEILLAGAERARKTAKQTLSRVAESMLGRVIGG